MTAAVGDQWSGEDWETYCRQLLAQRYGTSYQPVPDRDRGDLGIDGFTSDGEVFQCYAAQDPLDDADLRKKQRVKITEDLKKLENNIQAVSQLTAPAKINRWTLLVPRLVSRHVLQHAASKATQLRGKGLGGIGDAFDTRVLTSDDFSAEKQALISVSAALLPQPPPDATDESVAAWEASDPGAAATLSRKVAKLPGMSTHKEQQVCLELVKRHLHSAEAEEQLRRTQPQLWECLNGVRKLRERNLRAEGLVAAPSERRTLLAEVQEVRSRLESSLPPLQGGRADSLAWGIVADWLIRCPLDPVAAADM